MEDQQQLLPFGVFIVIGTGEGLHISRDFKHFISFSIKDTENARFIYMLLRLKTQALILYLVKNSATKFLISSLHGHLLTINHDAQVLCLLFVFQLGNLSGVYVFVAHKWCTKVQNAA